MGYFAFGSFSCIFGQLIGQILDLIQQFRDNFALFWDLSYPFLAFLGHFRNIFFTFYKLLKIALKLTKFLQNDPLHCAV